MNKIAPSALQGVSKTYAELLALEFGQCLFLHYGLLPAYKQECNFQSQQQMFSEKLLRLSVETTEESARVLLLGPGLQVLAEKLRETGRSVTLETNTLAASGNNSVQSELLLHHQSLESLNFNNRFDLVILEGTYHYLDQLSLLSKARELLQDSGRLLVFGEYLDDDSKIERSALPNLSSMRQLAERLSYKILDEFNFSADAANSIEQIQNIAERQKDKLNSLLEFDQLTKELEKKQAELRSKRRCFRLFSLQKSDSAQGEYALAEYAAIDSFDPVEISELFEKSFDTQFDADVWQWKYELGEGKCVVAREFAGGKIVSHYGGAPRQIQYFGEPNTAIQVCDVMVLPEIRRQYGKSSLFFKTAATFLEREIGNSVNHLLGFGFPNQKAMNIALRLGLYEKTDDFVELVFPAGEDECSTNSKLLPVDISNQQHQQFIDELWARMRADMNNGIVGDRHWRYIKYRYFDHPFAQSNLYRCVFLVNENSSPTAVVILKEHEERLLIMDLITAVANMKDVIQELSSLLSDTELKLWITRGWVESVRTDAAIENELGIEIPCNFWNPGPSSRILYGAWWLTSGDMDFM